MTETERETLKNLILQRDWHTADEGGSYYPNHRRLYEHDIDALFAELTLAILPPSPD